MTQPDVNILVKELAGSFLNFMQANQLSIGHHKSNLSTKIRHTSNYSFFSSFYLYKYLASLIYTPPPSVISAGTFDETCSRMSWP